MDIVFKPSADAAFNKMPSIPQENLVDLTKMFTALFTERADSQVRREGSSAWRQVSRFHVLSDEEITQAIDGKSNLFRAVAMDRKTAILIVRVPGISPYRTEEGALLLREILSRCDLQVSHYQFDEDWYFYLYLAEMTATNEMRESLVSILESAQFVVGEGTLEVLAEGEHYPVPLQPGFIWLDKNAKPVVSRKELSLEDSLRLFLCDADYHKNLCRSVKNWDALSKEDQASTQAIFEQILPAEDSKSDVTLTIWPVSA